MIQLREKLDISKLPGYVSDRGGGRGIAVVQKWTDADYERLRTQEEIERNKWLRLLALKDTCQFGCGDKHPVELHMAIIADRAALAFLAKRNVKPYGEVLGFNAFMRATGNKLLWQALIASVAGTFTNAVSALGVGDSTTAVTVTQTNLQGAASPTNRVRRGMNATYPSINTSPNDNQVVFRSDFPTGNAEYAWNEFGTFDNVTDGSGSMFNRGLFSPSPGTKGVGVSWTLTETLSNT